MTPSPAPKPDAPSDEEIVEAMAAAMERHMFADHELPLNAELHGKYLDNAAGVLAAARPLIEAQIRATSAEQLNDLALAKHRGASDA